MKEDDKVTEMENALRDAVLALQDISRKYSVCPRCFVELVLDHLEFQMERGIVPPHDPGPADTIGETKGSA